MQLVDATSVGVESRVGQNGCVHHAISHDGGFNGGDVAGELREHGGKARRRIAPVDALEAIRRRALPPGIGFCGDITAIKTAIMTYGVVDASILTDSAFDAYTGGIYQNANTNCNASPCYYADSDHVISLGGGMTMGATVIGFSATVGDKLG